MSYFWPKKMGTTSGWHRGLYSRARTVGAPPLEDAAGELLLDISLAFVKIVKQDHLVQVVIEDEFGSILAQFTLDLSKKNLGEVDSITLYVQDILSEDYTLLCLRIAAEILDAFEPGAQIKIVEASAKSKKWKALTKRFAELPPIEELALLQELRYKDQIIVSDSAALAPILQLDDNRSVSNSDLAKYLGRWHNLEALDGEGTPNLQFRLGAYINAAAAIRAADAPIYSAFTNVHIDPDAPLRPQIKDAAKAFLKWAKERGLRGIGPAMAQKIAWYVLTGAHPRYNELKRRYASIVDLMQVEGIGARMASRLFFDKGIQSLDELAVALEKGTVTLPTKPTEWVLRYKAGATGERIPWAVADKRYKEFERAFKNKFGADAAVKIAPAGSYRRHRADVKDLDVVVFGVTPADIVALSEENGWKVVGAGEDKVEPLIRDIKADVWVVRHPEEWGPALMYLTGSKQFNIMMRDDAKRHGWILNQRGLFAGRTEEAPIVPDSESEEGIFEALGWPWIPPEERDPGKFEFKVKNALMRKSLGLL